MVEVSRNDAAKLLKAIADFQEDMAKLRSPLVDVASKDVAKRFRSSPRVRATAQVYGGVQWARLSEGYLRSRPDRVTGTQLIDSGLLRRSFLEGRPGNITIASKNELRFGSNLERAVVQHRRRLLVVDHAGIGVETARAIAQEIEKI
ncbi:MAG: hypothetical protein HC771_22965 [Synechococcales cyanobacterium CRU_2_2]|nr:hypothetical protein [Synechococcales cyanobacterium CRU_2_2]